MGVHGATVFILPIYFFTDNFEGLPKKMLLKHEKEIIPNLYSINDGKI